MITSMRRCVACDDLWPWPISSRSFDLDFENRVRSVMFSVLDRLFFWLGIQYDPIVWVIMRRRGVSSERRRSSCSSCVCRCWGTSLALKNPENLSGVNVLLIITKVYMFHFACVDNTSHDDRQDVTWLCAISRVTLNFCGRSPICLLRRICH